MVPVLLAAAVVASGARADQHGVARPDGVAQETLSEVRVHGNTHTPEADVLKLAGLRVGQPLDQAAIEAAETRLRQSGRFDAVEIRKRHRSLDGGPEVALVIIVQEHPARGVGSRGCPSSAGSTG